MRLKSCLLFVIAFGALYLTPASVLAQGGPMPGGMRMHDRRTPDWAVGRFQGHNRKYNVDVTLTIRPDGDVRSVGHFPSGKVSRETGRFRDGKIHIPSSGNYYVEQTDKGIRLIQVNDPKNKASYHRVD